MLWSIRVPRVGLWGIRSWQIWVAGLAEHGLQPLFVEMPENLEAGGIGGRQKVLAICLMPMGVAGTHALMEWAVKEDPDGRDPTPALLSTPFLMETDEFFFLIYLRNNLIQRDGLYFNECAPKR